MQEIMLVKLHLCVVLALVIGLAIAIDAILVVKGKIK